MTREELKEHCKKQIEMCEMWAKAKGENPCGKVYEEHKMILELLKQEPCDDCVSRKAVEKIINKWLSHPDYELKDGIYDMTKKIHKLPSVTPQTKIGESEDKE